MKSPFYTIGLASLICFSYTAVSAQDVVSFKNSIQDVKVEPLTGNILVKTKDGISSINPESNKIDWTLDVNKVNNTTALTKVAKTYESLQNNEFSKAFSSTTDLEFIPNSPFSH